jgi:O-antigen/teichoic acid export membrane protein
MSSSFKSTLLLNALSLTAVQVGGRIIRFLYMLAIARMLGPEETGIYLYGIALYLGLIGVAQFGQRVFLAQRIGRRGVQAVRVIRHSLTIIAGAGVLVVLGLGVFIWASEQTPELRLALLCFVGALAARQAVNWVRGAYIALERTTWIPWYEIRFRGSEAIIGIGALLAGGGLLTICFLHFLFWFLEAYFSFRKLNRDHPNVIGFGTRWSYLEKVIPVSIIILSSIAAVGLFPQIAIILIRKLQPDADFVGQFGIAMQFMTTLMIIPTALLSAFLPRLSRAYRHGDGGRDLLTAAKLIILTSTAIFVLGASYGPWFVTLALGEKYIVAAELFRWLCWVFPPYAIVFFVGQSLNVLGARKLGAGIFGGMVTFHAVLLVAYVDANPAVAAIASMFISALAGAVLALYRVGNLVGGIGHGWWMKPALVTTVAYGIAGAGWVPPLIVAPVALLAAFGLALFLKIFDDHDIASIRRVSGRG